MSGLLAVFRPRDDGDIRVAVEFVLVVRISAEDLREILQVNGRSVGNAIEALDGERFPFHRIGSPLMLGKSTSLFSGTEMPTRRASSSTANSFSGTAQ